MPSAHLVDSSIFIFRAWFVLPDELVDRDGRPVNAVLGFADFLLALLERERPEHLACAFDESLGTSYRNELYPPYKANREPPPPELLHQFAQCRALVRAAGIPEFAAGRYEADDIIGTFCHHLRRRGWRSRIVSGDKDLAQLLGDGDLLLDPPRGGRLDRRGVFKTFGVYPEQIADLLALAGDPVDNIPGVPGVGRKTAARLLNRFGNLDALFAQLPAIGGLKLRGAARIQALLQEHEEAVRLWRELTVIQHHAGLPDEPEALRVGRPDAARLEALFEQWRMDEGRKRRWRAWLATRR